MFGYINIISRMKCVCNFGDAILTVVSVGVIKRVIYCL